MQQGKWGDTKQWGLTGDFTEFHPGLHIGDMKTKFIQIYPGPAALQVGRVTERWMQVKEPVLSAPPILHLLMTGLRIRSPWQGRKWLVTAAWRTTGNCSWLSLKLLLLPLSEMTTLRQHSQTHGAQQDVFPAPSTLRENSTSSGS